MPDLGSLLPLWRALDERFQRVEPTPWGAVVSDRRFSRIWDVNYARVETSHPVGLAEVERSLLPALRSAGARHEHIVLFHPDAHADLVTEASTRGDRLSWDAVMVLRDRGATAAGTVAVEEVDVFDEALWKDLATSLPEFDVTAPTAATQILRIERELLLPAGKRWFAVREGRRRVALGSLLVLAGAGIVDHVVTLPEARGRGYASAIVRRIVEEARPAGAGSLWLLTEPGGRAERLYQRLGFVTITRIASTLRPL